MKKVIFTQDYANKLQGETVSLEHQIAFTLVRKGVAKFDDETVTDVSQSAQVEEETEVKKPRKKKNL